MLHTLANSRHPIVPKELLEAHTVAAMESFRGDVDVELQHLSRSITECLLQSSLGPTKRIVVIDEVDE